MAADKAREFYDEQAKERQKEHGKTAPGKGKNTSGTVTGSVGDSRDAAGKALGVSGTLVDRARKVRKEGVPELAQAVEEGRMDVSMAAQQESNRYGFTCCVLGILDDSETPVHAWTHVQGR